MDILLKRWHFPTTFTSFTSLRKCCLNYDVTSCCSFSSTVENIQPLLVSIHRKPIAKWLFQAFTCFVYFWLLLFTCLWLSFCLSFFFFLLFFEYIIFLYNNSSLQILDVFDFAFSILVWILYCRAWHNLMNIWTRNNGPYF